MLQRTSARAGAPVLLYVLRDATVPLFVYRCTGARARAGRGVGRGVVGIYGLCRGDFPIVLFHDYPKYATQYCTSVPRHVKYPPTRMYPEQ